MRRQVHIFFVIVLLMLTACTESSKDNGAVLLIKVYFDDISFSQLLSDENNYTEAGKPQKTSYILYEKETQEVAYSGQFDGLEGRIYVQEGVYDLLLYTNDFNEYDANFFRGLDKKETAETHTRTVPLEDMSAGVLEMYMVEPDPTFSVLHENIVVSEAEEDNVVEVEFVQKSFKYYLTIKAKGLQNIHTAKMNISGMYTTAFLAHEEHRMDEAGIQTVEMDITRYDYNDETGEGELYGEFWSFGPNQNEEVVNSITLYFINGDVIIMNLKDLTCQIKTLTRGGEIVVKEVIELYSRPE